ncbi:MAG: TetR/AcrR family transcriptional regulator [Lachnospiraceae bacterium]|nr:TetR/AcrR family transcriptional regulator [Lachnospiraceae bacterium]
MEKRKIDRRVQYTRKMITDAFLDLLAEKPIEKITVKEICEIADVNRGTFYSHYKDAYDLLEQIQQEVTKDIQKYLESFQPSGPESEGMQLILNILTYLEEHQNFFGALRSNSEPFDFQNKIILEVEKRCIEEMFDTKIQEKYAEYIYSFSIAGFMGILWKWYDENLKTDKNEIAKLIAEVSLHGLAFFMAEPL